MDAMTAEHNLQLLNERVHALLNHKPVLHFSTVKDDLEFNFDRPKDLVTSNIFSVLLKPASVLKILEGHKYAQSTCFFRADCTVRLWNIPSGDLNAELKGHTNWVLSVAFSPDGKSIITGSQNRSVRIWSVATNQQVQMLNGHSHWIHSVAWSPNGDLIASGSKDKTVILWDAISGSMKKKLTSHTNWIYSVSFSQNGEKLASAGRDRTVIIWDVDSGAAFIKLAHNRAVWSVCFSHDDQFAVTGCIDNIVRMFNANNGREEKQFEGHADRVHSVACSFDSSIISSGSEDELVRLWDVASTKQLQQLNGHTSLVWSVAFSCDSKFIASGSYDKTVCLWNAPLLFQIPPDQPKE